MKAAFLLLFVALHSVSADTLSLGASSFQSVEAGVVTPFANPCHQDSITYPGELAALTMEHTVCRFTAGGGVDVKPGLAAVELYLRYDLSTVYGSIDDVAHKFFVTYSNATVGGGSGPATMQISLVDDAGLNDVDIAALTYASRPAVDLAAGTASFLITECLPGQACQSSAATYTNSFVSVDISALAKIVIRGGKKTMTLRLSTTGAHRFDTIAPDYALFGPPISDNEPGNFCPPEYNHRLEFVVTDTPVEVSNVSITMNEDTSVTIPLELFHSAAAFAAEFPVAAGRFVGLDRDYERALFISLACVDGTNTCGSGPRHAAGDGTVSFTNNNNNNGGGRSFTYTPTANAVGADSFRLMINTAVPNGPALQAFVTVTRVNTPDAPVAGPVSITGVFEDQAPIVSAFVVTEYDVGDTHTFIFTTLPTLGTVGLSGPATFVYTLNPNANGIDVFNYVVRDSTGLLSNEASITVTIDAVADGPTTPDLAYIVLEDGNIVIDISTELSHPDGSGVTYTTVFADQPGHGTVADLNNNIFLYTPSPNFAGIDHFTYNTTDMNGRWSVGNITITVLQVNDAPVATRTFHSTLEDLNPFFSSVAAGCTDPDEYPLRSPIFFLTDGPAVGLMKKFNTDGTFEYRPALDFNGNVTFEWACSDGDLSSNRVNTTVFFAPVNDRPVAPSPPPTTTLEDTPIIIHLNNSAYDPDGDALTYDLVPLYLVTPLIPTAVLHGTAEILDAANGVVRFTPEQDVYGEFFQGGGFAYNASDGLLSTGFGVVIITILPVNDPPVAANLAISLDEDTDIAAQAVATDVENDPLVFSIAQQPSKGVITSFNTTDGRFTYDAYSNLFGVDTFTFTAFDGALTSAAGTVTITINAINDAPRLVWVSNTPGHDNSLPQFVVRIDEDEIYRGDFSLYGDDVDGDALTYNILQTVNGVVDVDPISGAFNFTPPAEFEGIGGFVFDVTDGIETSANQTFIIIVSSVDDAPIGENVAVTIPEDGRLVYDINATDVDSLTLQYYIQGAASVGTAVVFLNGTAVYTPPPNFFGVATFNYQVFDLVSYSSVYTITVTVTAVNDAPVALPFNLSIVQDQPRLISLAAFASDVDTTDTLTYYFFENIGSVVYVVDQTQPNLLYLPPSGFAGTGLFEYEVEDVPGGLRSNRATVTIDIVGVNQAPTATLGLTFTGIEDFPLNGRVTGSDRENGSTNLVYTIVADPRSGTLTSFNNNTGNFTYTPDANFFGADRFSFTVFDGELFSAVAKVDHTVLAANDAPVAVTATYTAVENKPFTGLLSVSDVDGPSDSHTFSLVSCCSANPSSGADSLKSTVVITDAAAGLFTYTPGRNLVDVVDSFSFQVSDGAGITNIATASVYVSFAMDFYSCKTGEDVPPELRGPNDIEGRLVCDGFPDCADLSDEESSPSCQFPLTKLYAGVFFLCILLTIIAVILGVLTYIHRKFPIIKFSSPPFLYMIILGAILGYISVITFMQSPSKAGCVAQVWLPNIAFMLIFGVILLKTHRLYELFDAAVHGERLVITNRDLFIRVGALLFIDIVLLSIWTATDPPKPEVRQHPNNEPGKRQLFHEVCWSDSYATFLPLFLVFKFFMLIAGAYLAWETRRIDSRFKESKWIAVIVYNWLCLAVIVIPLILTSSTTPEAQFLYVSIVLLWVITVTLLCLFVPKLMGVFGFGYNEKEINVQLQGIPGSKPIEGSAQSQEQIERPSAAHSSDKSAQEITTQNEED